MVGAQPPSDADLIRAALAGDGEAFTRVVGRYREMLLRVARQSSCDEDTADDIVQDVVLRAYEKLAQLRDPARFAAWLRSIARNACREHALTRGREQPQPGIEAPGDDLVWREIAGQACCADIHAALARLPETYRVPMEMHYFGDESCECVGAALDLSEEAVKQRLFQGRNMLRQKLVGLMGADLSGVCAAANGSSEPRPLSVTPYGTGGPWADIIFRDDFSGWADGAFPDAWMARNIGLQIVGSPKRGASCAQVRHRPNQDGLFGVLAVHVGGAHLRGRRIRLSAIVQTDGSPGTVAQLWTRVDRPGGLEAFFDNMGDRPIVTHRRRSYVIEGPVAPDACAVGLGLMVDGGGTAWLEDLRVQALGHPRTGCGNEPRELAPEELACLCAFARVLGYVRYFYPSVEVRDADWEKLAFEGTRRAEEAVGPVDLACRLLSIFGPLAPGLRVWPSDRPPTPARTTRGEVVVWWQYVARQWWRRTLRCAPSNRALPCGAPDPDVPLVDDLPGGVTMALPLAVRAHAGLAPRPPRCRSRHWLPGGWHTDGPYGGGGRRTRLASAVLAWTELHHLRAPSVGIAPEREVALAEVLVAASAAREDAGFPAALEAMASAFITAPRRTSGPADLCIASVDLRLVERRIVVLHAEGPAARSAQPGDIVCRVDGRPARSVLRARASAHPWVAETFGDTSAVSLAVCGEGGQFVRVAFSRAGLPTTADLPLSALADRAPRWTAPREPVEDLAPGVAYLKLTRLNAPGVAAAIPGLQEARALVVDARGTGPLGYVGPAIDEGAVALLSHLIDARLSLPAEILPGQVAPGGRVAPAPHCRWVRPAPPRLGARVVFLADGVTHALWEAALRVARRHGLGDIVGSPTAGLRGRLCHLRAPGFWTLEWVEPRIVEYEGERFCGRPVEPTVPCEPTIAGIAAGRDEVLERALELLRDEGIGLPERRGRGGPRREGGEA